MKSALVRDEQDNKWISLIISEKMYKELMRIAEMQNITETTPNKPDIYLSLNG